MKESRGKKRTNSQSHSYDQSEENLVQEEYNARIKKLERRQNTRRSCTEIKNYAQMNENEMSEEHEDNEDEDRQSEDITYYQGGRIIRIYDQRVRQGTQQVQKFCKLGATSYLHVQWLTDKQIEDRNIQKPQFNKKQLLKQQSQIVEIQQKYGQNHFFNPSYKKVDRILTTAILFPAMHHKKASQMKGKWCESLTLVCQKILNFQKFNIPYGIIQKDDYEQEEIKKFLISDPIKLEHVINRLYLGRYKNNRDFWKDVGISLSNMQKVHKNSPNQYDSIILRQCTIFLYWQWFVFSRERYFQTAKQMRIPGKIEEVYEQNISFSLFGGFQQDWRQFKMDNILLSEKKMEIPTDEKQLDRLYPGQFTYSWLNQESFKKYEFNHLNKADLLNLSLNKQVDHLYLIKWCELDYDETSWQKESYLEDYKQKIKDFKLYTKVPPRRIRDKIQEHKKYHKSILGQMKGEQKQKQQIIDRSRRKLYCLAPKQGLKQYGGEDIPIYKDYKMLKGFQLQGLNWLIRGWHQRRNCILADQMGLGKTIQTIAFLNHLTVFEDVIGPFLVVAPVSTLKQWRYEIQQWSDLNCVLYKGKAVCRDLIEEYEFYHKFVTNEGYFVKFQKFTRFQVFLTNYELLLNQIDMIEKFPFQYIILDEAHKVKNQNTRIAKALRQLPCPRILLLTGTPIQNNTSQLWGLLTIIEPRRFHSFEQFKKRFGEIKSCQDLAELKDTLKPYLLRRVKSDVQKTIPKLSETLVTLSLTKIQKAYYKGIFQKNKNQLLNSLSSVSLNHITLCLRQCCNHPYMLSTEVVKQIERNTQTDEQKIKIFIQSCSKMIFVHKFLTKAVNNKEKTLIFTQFREMVQLLCDYCQYHSLPYQWLDGNVDYQERHSRIDRFNKLSQISVFVISTKAGGIGINLTAATNIIIYDSDWNPQNDIQAIARAHRIGQKKTVSVYRLITQQTYEEIIYRSAVKKLGIGLAILDDQFFTTQQSGKEKSKNKKNRTNQELQKLLKDGVAGFLKPQNEQKDGVNLQNISIEEIIQKSGKAIDYQTKQCSYTAARFQYQQEENKLDIDDPNFWEVALKDLESPLQKMVKKIKTTSLQKSDIMNSFGLQADLMIEANQIVYTFVRSKISMKNFNAQDERELKNFLEEIIDSRQFHKGLKQIANDWLEEIQKPSRRFDKLTVDEILNTINKGSIQTRQVITKNKARGENSRLLKTRNVLKNLSSGSEEGDEKQQLSEESSQNEQDHNKPENKTGVKRKNGVVVTNKNKNSEMLNQELRQLLEGICSFCFKKKCSKACDGMCNRVFHELCYQKYTKGEQSKGSQFLKQDTYSNTQLRHALSEGFTCIECSQDIIKCCLCYQASQAILYESTSLKYRKPKINESILRTDNNYIEKILNQSVEKQKNRVYQCRMPSCNRFFHLECLHKVTGKFKYEIDYIKEGNCYPIKCPSHFCQICNIPSSTIGQSCLQCPNACHAKCKPQKIDDYQSIYNQFFICKEHKNGDGKYGKPIIMRQQIEIKRRNRDVIDSDELEGQDDSTRKIEIKKDKKQRMNQKIKKKAEIIEEKSERKKEEQIQRIKQPTEKDQSEK